MEALNEVRRCYALQTSDFLFLIFRSTEKELDRVGSEPGGFVIAVVVSSILGRRDK